MLENFFTGQSLSIVVDNTTASEFTDGSSGAIFYTLISNLSKKKLHIEVKDIFLMDENKTQHSMDSHYKGYFGEDERNIRRDAAVICAPIFNKSKAGVPKTGYKYGLSVTDATNGIRYDAVFELASSGAWLLLTCDTEDVVAKKSATDLEKLLRKNIERFELLEEKKGIKIDALNVQISSNLSSLSLLGEISALTPDSVSEHIQIKANFYTVSGELVETADAIIDSSDFVGYDSFKITLYGREQISKMSRIRVFVK